MCLREGESLVLTLSPGSGADADGALDLQVLSNSIVCAMLLRRRLWATMKDEQGANNNMRYIASLLYLVSRSPICSGAPTNMSQRTMYTVCAHFMPAVFATTNRACLQISSSIILTWSSRSGTLLDKRSLTASAHYPTTTHKP